MKKGYEISSREVVLSYLERLSLGVIAPDKFEVSKLIDPNMYFSANFILKAIPGAFGGRRIQNRSSCERSKLYPRDVYKLIEFPAVPKDVTFALYKAGKYLRKLYRNTVDLTEKQRNYRLPEFSFGFAITQRDSVLAALSAVAENSLEKQYILPEELVKLGRKDLDRGNIVIATLQTLAFEEEVEYILMPKATGGISNWAFRPKQV
ncbi:hypothetical protein HOA92_00655 [archaeon]|mgnify:CR=1 FL=1|jgi:hypothetical protein|nr:hypothetical protein [archaeon]MBT6761527.1 hypothetical protein [archaeon]